MTKVFVNDGYVNAMAELGTARDKAAYSGYTHVQRNSVQLLTAYRSAWLPRKIVDIPALDSTRRWRAWSAGKEETTAIEAVEKRLGVQRKARDALIRARLYGGAAIYIATNTGDPELPLDPEREGRAGIRHLTIIPKDYLQPDQTVIDLDSMHFGLPEYYNIVGRGGTAARIHHTRLIRLIGSEVPHMDPIQAGVEWGDSVLISLFEAIAQADGTAANVASLVFESKVDVIHIPRLMEILATPKGEQDVQTYIRAAMTAKGVNGALILDGGDTSKPNGQTGGTTFESKTQSFGGLDAIWDRFLQAVSGASDIPATRLLGQSPTGLNATGESDLRNYYDRIQSYQTLDLEPAFNILDQLICWEATKKPMDDIHYNWRSLWQTTDTERAALAKTTAETLTALKGTMLWNDDVLAAAGANAMIETGAFPGFEAALDDYGADTPDEPDEPVEDEVDTETAVVPGQRPKLRVVDATPRTLYVRRNVLNADAILRWARGQGFTDLVAADDLHVTVALSRTPVDWMQVGESFSSKLEIGEGGPRMMEQFGEAKVLIFGAQELLWRHNDIVRAGASWDHPDYNPHITLTYSKEGPDLKDVKAYTGPILLGPEIFEEVKEEGTQP